MTVYIVLGAIIVILVLVILLMRRQVKQNKRNVNMLRSNLKLAGERNEKLEKALDDIKEIQRRRKEDEHEIETASDDSIADILTDLLSNNG